MVLGLAGVLRSRGFSVEVCELSHRESEGGFLHGAIFPITGLLRLSV